MKHLLMLVTLLLSLGALADTNCRTITRPIGVFYNTCPSGTVVDGVDTIYSPPGPYANTRVRCVRQETICRNIKEDLEKEEDTEN